MRIDIVTIFPDYFTPLELSLIGKARAAGILDLRLYDLRSWTNDRHRTVDDTPYGGGPGMVMKPGPWGAALEDIRSSEEQGPPRLVVPTPSGAPFTQRRAGELAEEPWLVFACGRYEGIDARVMAEAERHMPVTELSIGDYVLAGGESATLVMVETITRLLPGVLGNAASAVEDSFAPGAMANLLEGPVYTKPLTWQDHEVPAVLASGNHASIARWRRDEALRKTVRNRPDLAACLAAEDLDQRDREVLAEARFQNGAQPMAD